MSLGSESILKTEGIDRGEVESRTRGEKVGGLYNHAHALLLWVGVVYNINTTASSVFYFLFYFLGTFTLHKK